jgi:putative NIF3 family GTP cyclohydrolase 1 type 2
VKRVRKIAWCSGSGASLFPEIVRHKPDVFITGDVKYHDALDFQMEGITVVDIGHFASEQGMRKALAKRLRRSLKKLGSPIPVYTSRSELDPFKVL